MTKRRAPLTVDAAVTRAAGIIPGGYTELAELTGRQPWLVRAWGDPDRRERIPLHDALIIDRACLDHAGEAPFGQYYTARIDAAGGFRAPSAEVLARQVVDVIRECGEAHTALFEAALPGATPAQIATARRELEEALAVIHRTLPMLVGRAAYDQIFTRKPDAHERAPP